ncbi:MtrB/PioB family outer membrane beta-barrel protein [Rudaea sp.]|uniref:MtrB/PioB family outer membrane beta-barrel protein n=1 Tax=Rudaea sp. TaxID=2136325 RepID=UPI002ED6B974
MPKNSSSLRLLALGCVVALAAAAHADSGIGVDTWRGNKLDPTGGKNSSSCDANGRTWLSPLQHRTPTGYLYDCPDEAPLAHELGEWLYYGVLQVGYTGISDQPFALWNRYADWRGDKAILGLLDAHFENPSDGSYAEVRGSRISEEDQYYQAVYGKAGAYKVQAFVRDMPNILSTDARSIWKGTGTGSLTLPSSLVAGASTPAQVAAVSNALPNGTLQVTRKKQGLNASAWLTPNLTVYVDMTDEERKGGRPYGGPFGESWLPAPGGAVLETVKPINDSTINVNAGVRWVDPVWRFDVGYSGSFYRDKYQSYTFQQPFLIVPGATATIGQMSTEPDNDYHNLHAQLSRVLPLNGDVSLTLSDVLMRNTDGLIAPTNCQGFVGTFDCSKWNTTAALSQTNADVTQRNQLAELKASIQPVKDWSFNGGIKYSKQDYKNNYLALNPLTGQYGYIGENAQFAALGIPLSFSGPYPIGGIPGRVKPWILTYEEYNAYAGATWKISDHDTLGLVYNFDRYKPSSRERTRVDDNSLKLTWVDKTLDWLTFRANYTYLHQSGDRYNQDVWDYGFAFELPAWLAAFPGSVAPVGTVEALRKYDISDRKENKIDLMATLALRDDLSISASFRGDYDVYRGVQVGRQGYFTYATQVSAEWTPTTADNFSAFVGLDHSRLDQASVAGYPNDSNSPTCAPLGCASYPLTDRWWQSDRERNYSAGLTALHRWRRASFDFSWNYIYARGNLFHTAASSGAIGANFAPISADVLYATMGNGMPPTTYRVNSLTVGATIAINTRLSLRLFDSYEVGRVYDWHYEGLDQGLVIANQNTLYTDGGPQSYKQNLVGFLVNIKL